MYNYNELQAVELSPTKKDYYQIWSELIDVARKLSTRWDPSATNESDPGIILLKVLTAVADKLAYNIDANTLEAFMPSAAQESSMRKLCEMLGYSMQYFKSASTQVRISYKGISFPTSGVISIDRFTNIKDADSKVNYITLQPVQLSQDTPSVTVDCLEGELVTCQTENGTVITLNHLDDNNRFYLPEQQVASNDNCVFISNVTSPVAFWPSTTNLNTILLGTRVYQFGFDSSRGLPYVQFPEDISDLIGEGLYISFVRTHGVSGNISVRQLSQMEKPASWSLEATSTTETKTVTMADVVEGTEADDLSWQDLEQYSIANLSKAINGKNPETIDEAYWNYQKTIGTFDTLVTCRDYMNKIYQMTKTDIDSTPLVSNIIVSDIRDDINRAYTVCTYTDQGLEYVHKPEKKIKKVIKDNSEEDIEEDRIEYFDLVLYPFETIYGTGTKAEFISSFKYTNQVSLNAFDTRLSANKTIAHRLCLPESGDIVCIKIYFRLSARLATTSKVSTLEAIEIEQAAHTALYKAFNMRNMSFGDELPYDSILKTLTFADARIKNVILDDPKMYVVACYKNGEEVVVIDDTNIYVNRAEAEKALNCYKELVLKNVLAGKVALFNFNTDYSHNFEDKLYPTDVLGGLDATFSLKDNNTVEDGTISAKELHDKNYINYGVGTVDVSMVSKSSEDGELLSFRELLNSVDSICFDLYTKGSRKAIYTICYTPFCSVLNADINPNRLKLTVLKDGVDITKGPDRLLYFSCVPDSSLVAFDSIEPKDSNKNVTLCQIPFNCSNDEDAPSFDKIGIRVKTKPGVVITDINENLSFKFTWNEAVSETNKIIPEGSDSITLNSEESNIESATYQPEPVGDDGAITIYWPGQSSTTQNTSTVAPVVEVMQSGYTACLEACGYGFRQTLGTLSFEKLSDLESKSDIAVLTFSVGTNKYPTGLRLKPFKPSGTSFPTVSITEVSDDHLTLTIQTDNTTQTSKTYTLWELLTFTANHKNKKLYIDIARSDTLLTFDFDANANAGSIYYNPVTANYSGVIEYSIEPNMAKLVGTEIKLDYQASFVARKILWKKIDKYLYCSDLTNNEAWPTVLDSSYKQVEHLPEISLSNKYYYTIESTNVDWVATDSKKETPQTISYDPYVKPMDWVGTLQAPIVYNSDTNTLEKKAEVAVKGISGIESNLVIKPENISVEEPLVLARHEVIQFRAPNFKTVNTYPAYVNYFVKLNNDTGSNAANKSQAAVPATMWSLRDFFNGGTAEHCKVTPSEYRYFKYVTLDTEGKPTNDWFIEASGPAFGSIEWCKRKSWEEKVNSMPESLLYNIWTTKSTTAGAYSEATEQQNYLDYTNKYGGVFVKDDSGRYNLFEIPDNTDKTKGIPPGLAFYVVYITESNFGDFIQWLQGNKGSASGRITYRTANEAAALDGVALITGVYSQARPNLSRKLGHLIDISKFKYAPIDSYGVQPTTVLDTFFVPQLWASDTSNYTKDGLGKDAKTAGISANAEYMLKAGEYVLITYTTSEGREDGSTIVKNIAYGPGQIIKTNFELTDSIEKSAINKYPKTSNYGPWELKEGNSVRIIMPTEVPGMYSFGATEQLEVREPIIVDLNEKQTYLYWEINPSNQKTKEINGVTWEYFPFDADGKYILQHGEYLFYTNEAKEGIAYYGAGSQISLKTKGNSTTTPVVGRVYSEEPINVDEAADLGLAAVIPWTKVTLSRDKYIEIAEYQLINLAEGDELQSISFHKDADSTILHEKFARVTGAKYKCNGKTGELPSFDLVDSKGDSIYWEVRGKLELNLNSTIPQTLTVHKTPSGAEQARSMIKILGKTGTDEEKTEVLYTITPQMTAAGQAPAELSIYSNIVSLGPDGKFAYSEDDIPEFKLCEYVELTETAVGAEPQSYIPDFENGFSTYSLAPLHKEATEKTLSLNALIEDNHFGLLALYLVLPKADDSANRKVYITAKANDTVVDLKYFNRLDPDRDQKITTLTDIPEGDLIKYFEPFKPFYINCELVNGELINGELVNGELSNGMNLIVIPESCTLTIKAQGTLAGDVLMIGELKTVPLVNQLNPQLAFASNANLPGLTTTLRFKYHITKDTSTDDTTSGEPAVASTMESTTNATTETDIEFIEVSTAEVYDWLRDKAGDSDFYYTNEPDNVSGLDLNPNDPTDTLAQAKNWFDTQNIVNKFVVSQLDPGYLSDYIGVSKFSKI